MRRGDLFMDVLREDRPNNSEGTKGLVTKLLIAFGYTIVRQPPNRLAAMPMSAFVHRCLGRASGLRRTCKHGPGKILASLRKMWNPALPHGLLPQPCSVSLGVALSLQRVSQALSGMAFTHVCRFKLFVGMGCVFHPICQYTTSNYRVFIDDRFCNSCCRSWFSPRFA